MDIERRPQIIAKRLWNILRIVFHMVRKGISKSKLMLDLQMMFKRGKVVGKAIENLIMLHHRHHYAALTCRSNDVHMSFISPREYEFSCSNSPAVIYPSKRKNRRYHYHHRYDHRDDADEKELEMLSNYGSSSSVEASPLALPGFGFSPVVRQLRVTDSPFPLKEMEENDSQVDKDAEEFIKKFYNELKKQRRAAAFESPSPYPQWSR